MSQTLTVTHSENIRLNGTQQGSTNTFKIGNIRDIYKRIITLPENQDTTILSFEESVMSGGVAASTATTALDKDNVKYVRITNLDTINYMWIGVVGTADNFTWKISPGESFVMGETAATLPAQDLVQVPVFGGANGLEDLEHIIADPGTNSTRVEIFVAGI